MAEACCIAIVSWPIGKPMSSYVILGEPRKGNMFALKRDIGFLYPFRWRGKLPKEFDFYREKYNLTDHRIVGEIHDNCVMRSPILYDLSCSVPVFSRQKPPKPSPCKDRVVIVMSYENPIDRGNLLSNCLDLCPKLLLLLGNKCQKMYKYLLCRRVNTESMIKMAETEGLTTSIVDSLEILAMMELDPKEIYIACLSEQVSKIRRHIQKLKYNDVLQDRAFFFVCEN